MPDVIDIRTRKPVAHPHLRLVEAVQQAVRRAGYEEVVSDGYSPKVMAIPGQKKRGDEADIHDMRGHL